MTSTISSLVEQLLDLISSFDFISGSSHHFVHVHETFPLITACDV